ncbi:hypothetical protein Pyn_11350 [Prunus yedoensis var. nudiflora]|uniref:Uncharacterized protein n=1 Tax=Prunus yedoensis var. nudiflora TaxID=2094558 RepID=A0A314YLT5_PRUYE|nr:hypothetical protein Pyn_11350 [Prunus yedoensis var. nudiflora]
MKHISLSPSTEFAEIAISIASFSPPSSPRSVHRTRLVRQNLFSPSENEPSSSTNLKGKTPNLVMIGSRTLCNGFSPEEWTCNWR